MIALGVWHSMQHVAAASTAQAAERRVAGTWPWYVVRAAGFTAAGLLILLMLSGIGQVTGLTYRVLEPVKAWVVHKALAFALCAAIVVHVSFLLIDKFRPFNLWEILVPFVSTYTNKTALFGLNLGRLAVTLGVLAMYGVAISVLSSLGWIDTKKGRWRKLHYISYFVMLFAFVHALGVGSDLKYGTFREAWIAVGFILLLAIVGRLWRAGTLRKTRDDNEKL